MANDADGGGEGGMAGMNGRLWLIGSGRRTLVRCGLDFFGWWGHVADGQCVRVSCAVRKKERKKDEL